VPITPFHLGPGALFKAAAPRHFSFTVFAFSQGLIDLEPIGFFLFTGDPVHPYLHTFLGATLVFLASWGIGRPVCEWVLRLWNTRLSPAQARWLAQEPAISATAAGIGAFVGAYSHVAIDSIMHGDMAPFAPFSPVNPSLLVVSVESLQWLCVLAGLAGIAVMAVGRWRERGRGGMNATAAVLADLAPGGRLRVGINYGNVVLASRDPASGELRGVHVDLARELASRLGVPADLQGQAAAGTLVEALKAGSLDVVLLSFEPSRAREIAYSPIYLSVDATYLVPPGSPLRTAEEVDRPGARIAIAAKGVYEYYLKSHLKYATLVSAPSTHAAFERFAAERLDALVGLRPRLAEDLPRMPGARIVDGRFMRVEQALATRSGHPAGADFVRNFVHDVLTSGLLARIVEDNGVRGVTIAPAEA